MTKGIRNMSWGKIMEKRWRNTRVRKGKGQQQELVRRLSRRKDKNSGYCLQQSYSLLSPGLCTTTPLPHNPNTGYGARIVLQLGKLRFSFIRSMRDYLT